jgi:hypothetical protein
MSSNRLTKEDFDRALGLGESGRKVRVTFRRDAESADLAYFMAMFNRGNLFFLSLSAATNLAAVRDSGRWGSDKNRTVDIELTCDFDRSWFEGRTIRALEKIEHIA